LIVETGGDKSGKGATDGGSHGKRAPHCSQCERSSELAALHRAQNPKPSGVLISGISTQSTYKESQGSQRIFEDDNKSVALRETFFPSCSFRVLCESFVYFALKNFIPTSRF
jgi:hypothetical protein